MIFLKSLFWFNFYRSYFDQLNSNEVIFFHKKLEEIVYFLYNNKVWLSFYVNNLKDHLIDVKHESNQ